MLGVLVAGLGALLAVQGVHAVNPQVLGVSIYPREVTVFGTTKDGTAWVTHAANGTWNPPQGVLPFYVRNVSTLTAYPQPGHYDVFGVRGAPPPPGVATAFNIHWDGQNLTQVDLGPAIGRLSQAVQADDYSGQLLKRVVARNADRRLVTRWATSNDSAWHPDRWWTLDSDLYDSEPRVGAIKPGRYDVFAIANGTMRWLYAATSDTEGRGNVGLEPVPGGLCSFSPTTLDPPGIGLLAVGCDSSLYYKDSNGTKLNPGWKNLGPVWGVAPGAIVLPGPHKLLWALKNDTDSTYVYQYFDESGFKDWAKLGNDNIKFASLPQTVVGMEGTIWFFGVGEDNHLYYYRWIDKKLPIEPFKWIDQGSILFPGSELETQ